MKPPKLNKLAAKAIEYARKNHSILRISDKFTDNPKGKAYFDHFIASAKRAGVKVEIEREK